MLEKFYRYGKIKKVNIETKYFADCPKGWRVANDLVCGEQKLDAFAVVACRPYTTWFINLLSLLDRTPPACTR